MNEKTEAQRWCDLLKDTQEVPSENRSNWQLTRVSWQQAVICSYSKSLGNTRDGPGSATDTEININETYSLPHGGEMNTRTDADGDLCRHRYHLEGTGSQAMGSEGAQASGSRE